jgi:hypothetical protein
MKKIIFVFALTSMFITSAFSQKTWKICSKENQQLVDDRFVPSDTLGEIPMNGKFILSKKEIAIYSGSARLFNISLSELKQTYKKDLGAEFFSKKRNIIIRIWDATPISKGWVMIIKDDKATTYNYCK